MTSPFARSRPRKPLPCLQVASLLTSLALPAVSRTSTGHGLGSETNCDSSATAYRMRCLLSLL